MVMTNIYGSEEAIALSSPSNTATEQRAKIFAALADPTRLRIVELLIEAQELSGSELASRTNISLALFCHHARTLAEAGIITPRKEGQTKYHALNRELLADCFASLSRKLT
jgi:DNA-binding transcriptional ArsR family regulator